MNQAYNDEAMRLQQEGQWQKALELWEHDAAATKADPLSRYNLVICKYHLGQVEEVAEESLNLLPVLPRVIADSCAALALLSNHKVGRLGLAKSLARAINERISNPWDLPSVPFVADARMMLESGSGEDVMEALSQLLNSSDCTERQKNAISSLLGRYQQRENARKEPSMQKR